MIARLRDRTPDGQTFSAGICEWRRAGGPDNPATLVAHADQALYEAKKNGRNRTVLARPAEPPYPAPARPEIPRQAGPARP